MKTITINTDASYDPTFGLATFAYWIESDDYVIKESGIFPRKIVNSSVAELLTIEKAIRRIECEHKRKEKLHLIFYTDSKWSMDAIEGRVKVSRFIYTIRAIQHSMKPYTFEMHHVRSHRNDQSTQGLANHWCDREAINLLRQELGR